MKKMIYSIINDDIFGIKVKEDMKLNILRILDIVKSKVVCNFYDPVQIKNNKIKKFSLEFFCPEDSTFLASYKFDEHVKFLRISLLPTVDNPNVIEDYIIECIAENDIDSAIFCQYIDKYRKKWGYESL